MKIKLITVHFILFAAAFVIQSQQALATATTHIWAPSTDIQAFKLWHITSDMYVPVEKDDFGNRWSTVTNLGLTVGILPFKNLNAEIGVDHKSGLGMADDYPLYGNFKIGVPENAWCSFSPAFAVGAFDIGTKKNITNYNVFYGKLAKSVSLNKTTLGRFSIGYFSGNKNLLVDDKFAKDNSGIMAAWERTFPELSDKFWFCVEYMGTKSVYGTLNVGASWKFASNVALLAGYDLYNNSNLVDTATLQVDIDF
jgi:hypothetical protein